MNERIKEFAQQAWPELPGNWWERKDGAVAEAVEKFAELIVKECIDIANKVHMCRDGRVVAEDIKQHFGVEL